MTLPQLLRMSGESPPSSTAVNVVPGEKDSGGDTKKRVLSGDVDNFEKAPKRIKLGAVRVRRTTTVTTQQSIQVVTTSPSSTTKKRRTRTSSKGAADTTTTAKRRRKEECKPSCGVESGAAKNKKGANNTKKRGRASTKTGPLRSQKRSVQPTSRKSTKRRTKHSTVKHADVFANGHCVTNEMREQAMDRLVRLFEPILKRAIRVDRDAEVRLAFPTPRDIEPVAALVEGLVCQEFGESDPHRYILRIVEIEHHLKSHCGGVSSSLEEGQQVGAAHMLLDSGLHPLAQTDYNAEAMDRAITRSLVEAEFSSPDSMATLDIGEMVRTIIGVKGTAGQVCKNKECGAQDVSYELKQLRSGDEGMTAVCTCRVCGDTQFL